jgi:hypothetical protein
VDWDGSKLYMTIVKYIIPKLKSSSAHVCASILLSHAVEKV